MTTNCWTARASGDISRQQKKRIEGNWPRKLLKVVVEKIKREKNKKGRTKKLKSKKKRTYRRRR